MHFSILNLYSFCLWLTLIKDLEFNPCKIRFYMLCYIKLRREEFEVFLYMIRAPSNSPFQL